MIPGLRLMWSISDIPLMAAGVIALGIGLIVIYELWQIWSRGKPR